MIQDLSLKVRHFCEEREWDQFHQPKDLAIGLVTESSELLELFRFLSEEQIDAKLGEATFRKKVEDELSDILFFLLRMADRQGIDLIKCFESKLQDNAKKYPVEKSKGKNLKYNELK